MKKGIETKENLLFRILSLILVNVILISLFAPYSTVFASATDGKVDIKLLTTSTDETIIEGNTYAIQVQLDYVPTTGINLITFDFNYDTSLFKIDYDEDNDEYVYSGKQSWSFDVDNDTNPTGGSLTRTELYSTLNKTIFTFTLKALKNADNSEVTIDVSAIAAGATNEYDANVEACKVGTNLDSHTVTYDYATNGGESSTLSTKDVRENSAIDLSATATKTGYNFIGWNTDANAKVGLSTLDMSTNDVTLYAIFSKEITTTFKYYSETTEKQENVVGTMYNNDENVTIKTPIGKTYTDEDGKTWTKNGWTTSINSSTIAGIQENTDITVNSNNTYYMLYKRNITLSYNVNGGSSIAPTNGIGVVAVNSADVTSILGADMLIDSSIPVKTGYTFLGWNTKQDGTGNILTGTQNLTKDTTLYAKWTPNTNTKYTVEHYKEQLDGSYIKADTDNLAGITDTQVTAQAKTNYTGYNLDTNVTGTVTGGTILGDGSLVLKLYYKLNEYTVTFKNDNGTIVNTQKVKFGGNAELPSNPTKDKDEQYTYTFEKWVNNNGEDVDLTNITSDMEVFASYTKEKNKYTVTFDVNGGDSLSTNTKTVEYGKTYGELPTPTKEGYTFEGWYDSETDGNKIETTTIVKATKNHVLYARWKIKTYNIKFIGINSLGEETILATAKVEHGNNVTSANLASQGISISSLQKDVVTPEFTYKYTGMDTNKFYNVTEDREIQISYNKVKNKYRITFYNDDKVTILGNSEVEYGENADDSYINPEKESDDTYTYTFSNWVDENDNIDNLSNVTASRNVYAKYIATYKNYTVEFVDENGTTISKKDDYHYGDNIVLPENPTKEGNVEYTYTFEGWTSGNEEVVDFDNVTVSGNVKYTAKYGQTKNKYTVTFYDENKTTKLGESTVDYGTEATITNPTKEDENGYTYVFEKWTSETGEDDDLSNVTANRNVYAKYTQTPIIYNIEYIDTFGLDNSQNPTTYTVEDDNIMLKPLEGEEGMTFEGWYTSETYETEIKSIVTSQLGNIKVYAKWNINLYLKSKVYKIGTNNNDEKLDEYVDGDLYLYRVSPKTKLKDFIDNCETNGEITVYKPDGTILGEDEFVGTGMTLKDKKGSKEISILIAVIGDLDGNGEVDITDLVNVRKHIQNIKSITGVYLKAGDINEDETSDITDLVKIRRHIQEIEYIK